MFYAKPGHIISKVNQILNNNSSAGEDEMVRITNSICQCMRDPSHLLWHREFVVSHEPREAEVYFSGAAITIVTCRINPVIHTG
jgi:hypothetical protein